MRRPAADPLAALCALLDRSLIRIEAAAADARRYNRSEITDVSDIWDSNTRPLFAAVGARTAWGRRRRAGRALRWMAVLGESRRTRTVEQAALAGHDLSWLPPVEPHRPYRDQAGNIQPISVPYTPGAVADYRLDRAVLRRFRAERAASPELPEESPSGGRRSSRGGSPPTGWLPPAGTPASSPLPTRTAGRGG